MKNGHWNRLGFFLFLLFALFTTITAVAPLTSGVQGKWFVSPCDFSLRMTEIECLKKGVNPFDVWHGDVVMPPYFSNYECKVSGPEFTEMINAYAPWEYGMMLPFSFVSRRMAWAIYFGIMMASLVLISFVGKRVCPALAYWPLLRVGVKFHSCVVLSFKTWYNTRHATDTD